MPNRVAGCVSPPAPTLPGVRVRTGRFSPKEQTSRPRPPTQPLSPRPCSPANTTHLNPGQELAEVLRAWLSDGLPLPESAESKCQRVRVAREAAGLGTDSVRHLIEAEFDGRTSPQQLSSGECDRWVAMVEGVRRSA